MSPAVTSPDLLLARRAAAGHESAWEKIVDRYGRRIYNLAYQFGGTAEAAEDLTQDIFLRLYRTLGSYRGEVPLAGWALRLARNLCIDRYRRERRRGTEVEELVLEALPTTDDPRRDAIRRQEVAAVYAALDELPDELAEIIVLRDLQEWTGQEVADALGIAVGTVKSRLHRARQALTELVRPLLVAAVEEAARRAGGEP